MKLIRAALAVTLSITLVALSPGLGGYYALANMIGSAVSIKAGPGAQAGAAGAVGAMRSGPQGAAMLPLQVNLGGSLVRPGAAPGLKTLSRPAAVNTAATAAGVSRTAPVAASPALPKSKVAAVENSARAPPAARQSRGPAPAKGMRPGVGPAAASKYFGGAAKSESKTSAFTGLNAELPAFGEMSRASAKDSAHTDFMSRIGSFKSRSGAAAMPARVGSMGALRASVTLARSRGASKKSRAKDMPPVEDTDRGSEVDVNDLDDLGNPARRQDPGPDDVYDEFGGDGGRSNSDLFALAAPLLTGGALLGGAALAGFSPAVLVMIPLYLGLIVPSLILHEMGHAWMADRLGDPTSRLQGRMSFKPRNLLTHIHPIFTVVVPIATMLFAGILFGGARPVPVNPQNFKDPVKDMAKVAMAGPAVNFMIAAAAGLAHTAVVALGATGLLPSLLTMTVFFNVMLGMFNLLPFAPLDGHHVVRHVLTNVFKAPQLAAKLDSMGQFQFIALIGTVVLASPYLLAAIKAVTGVFLFGSALVLSAQSAILPIVATLGLIASQMGEGNRIQPPNAMGGDTPVLVETHEVQDSVDLIVRFSGASKPLNEDLHLAWVDVKGSGGMQRYAAAQHKMSAQLQAAGLDAVSMHGYGATPIATYRRINAATIRVPKSKATRFRVDMEAKGYKVYENERREIIRPIEDDPNAKGVEAAAQRGNLSMPATLRLSTMDTVHQAVRKEWGPPVADNALRRLLLRVLRALGVDIPQPKIGVIDTGVDVDHKLIKPGLLAAKDIRPTGDGKDDNGHGTWVTSMVLWFAPWLKNVTHYKAFVGGGASLDDVLKALTMAGNDGNLVVSNSWGSSSGNPKSPDSLMVKKLAEEGHIMVFSAGNSGYYGKNTIGSPAIVHYRDAATKAMRVISVAATDAEKKVVGFSSKGPGSRTTSRGEEYKDYPRKPDAAEQGYNTESGWPSYKRPGRVDPELGPVKAISGTSMSTPKFAGTIAMLAQAFGVTKVGEDLDRVVNAVMSVLTNEHNQGDTAIGDGFNEAYAAYQILKNQDFAPKKRGRIRRFLMWLLDRGSSDGLAGVGVVPQEAIREHRRLVDGRDAMRVDLRRHNFDFQIGWQADLLEAGVQGLNETEGRIRALEKAYPSLKRG